MPKFSTIARLGYAMKGVVYILIGLLAALTAFGSGGQTTGSRGAMHTLSVQPFGRVLLGVVALGLAAYVAWQFFRAFADPEHGRSDKAKDWVRRAGYLGSGLLHAGLVLAAVPMALGGGSSGDDDSHARDWTAHFMSYPFGRWIVALGGVGVAAFGVRQIYRGYTADLDHQLSLSDLQPLWRTAALRISRAGMAARGIVFSVVGILLMLAAYRANPSEAKGLGGALDALQRQPYGPWLLGAVALGLISYGIYLFIRARYRRFEIA